MLNRQQVNSLTCQIAITIVVLIFGSGAMAAAFTEDFESQTDSLSTPWTITNLGARTPGYLSDKAASHGASNASSTRSVGAITPGQDIVLTGRLNACGVGLYSGSSLGFMGVTFGDVVRMDLLPGDSGGKWDVVYSGTGAAGVLTSYGTNADTWYDVMMILHWNAGTSSYATATAQHRLSAAGDSGAWTIDYNAAATSTTFAIESAYNVTIFANDARIDDIGLENTLFVPEPATFVLLGFGGLVMLKRRRFVTS